MESLGYYHPRDPDHKRGIRIDVERLQYWISQGAQPSETVVALTKKHYPHVKLASK
jgi:small subunit ribosomal protein S16